MDKLHLTAENSNNVYTIHADGRLDSETAYQLDEVLQKILPVAKKIVIDCACLTYISSAGLRSMLSAQKRIKKHRIRLINTSPMVQETLFLTGFDSILEIC